MLSRLNGRTSSELEDSVLEDVPGISSLVHQVKLSQHSDGTNTCIQYSQWAKSQKSRQCVKILYNVSAIFSKLV